MHKQSSSDSDDATMKRDRSSRESKKRRRRIAGGVDASERLSHSEIPSLRIRRMHPNGIDLVWDAAADVYDEDDSLIVS